MRSVRMWPGVVAGPLLCGVAALLGARAPAGRAAQIDVTWLGHATFLIVSPGGTRLLIDPWLKGNPATPDSLQDLDRKSTRLNSSHGYISYAVFCLKKKIISVPDKTVNLTLAPFP